MNWLKKLTRRFLPTPAKPSSGPKPPLSVTEQMMAAMLADGLSIEEIRVVYADMEQATFDKTIRRVVKRLPTFFDG